MKMFIGMQTKHIEHDLTVTEFRMQPQSRFLPQQTELQTTRMQIFIEEFLRRTKKKIENDEKHRIFLHHLCAQRKRKTRERKCLTFFADEKKKFLTHEQTRVIEAIEWQSHRALNTNTCHLASAHGQ